MLHMIESDAPFYVVFLELLEPGDIPDQYGSHNIITCLYCMTGFGILSASGLMDIKSDQI